MEITSLSVLLLLLQAPATAQTPPAIEETIDVVSVTPVHGLGVPKEAVPANIQVLTTSDFRLRPGTPAGELLSAKLASVNLNETQNNPFQPDLQFRGFTASPLLGLSQGIAVYVDGVRANEPFGDTVNWELVPMNAIASMNLVPGSNPLFGLNALGGALSLQTKTGFSDPGHDIRILGGAFGRRWFDVQSGGHRGSLSYFVSATGLAEEGWRKFSPSRLGQFFGNVEWRDGGRTFDLTFIGGAGRLVGNGPAPVELMEIDRREVFTHPDRTTTRLGQVIVRAGRASATSSFDSVFYVRPATIRTLNGDDTPYDECEDEDFEEFLCEGGGDAAILLDTMGRPIPTELDGLELNATNNTSETRTRGWGGTVQTTRVNDVGGRANHLVAGASFDRAGSRYGAETEMARLDDSRGTIGSGIFSREALVDVRTTATHASLYLTNFLTMSPRVTLTGGARFTQSWVRLRDQLDDDLDGDHSFRRINPTAGITIGVGARASAFASYSQASRVPTPSELSCADPEDPCRLPNAFVADPPLEQVVAKSIEGGVRGGARGVSWSASVFRTAVSDDIIFISSGALTNTGHFANVGDTRREGLETSLGMTRARVTWNASYTLLRARFLTPLTLSSPNHPDEIDGEIQVPRGSDIPGLPRHQLKGELVVRAGAGSFVVDGSHASSFFSRGDEANRLEPIAQRTLVNFGADWRVSRRLRFVGRITNVLNAEYSSFGVLGEPDDVLGDDFEDPRFVAPGAPRAAWAGIEIVLR